MFTHRLPVNLLAASAPVETAPLAAVAEVAPLPQEQAIHSSPLPLTVIVGSTPEAPALPVQPSVFAAFAARPQPEMPADGIVDAFEPLAPTPEPSPAAPPPAYIIYTVEEGDTVGGLATEYNISSSSVIWSNPGLEDENSLSPGQSLRIPMSDGIVYDVQPGDTLSDIASRFDVDVQTIIDVPANNLASADSIAENQTIFVPGGTMPEPVATPTPEPVATPEPTEPEPAPVPTPPSDSSGVGARAVELARSRTGSPYVPGGAGPSGFDCSGLVFWVYSQLGYSVPRAAPDQYAWTTPVSQSDMQPGDLVFFTNTYSSAQWITHVGIYVGGGGVIMAVDEGDIVREVSLGEAYWSEHFAAAGRPPY